jgi:hypothetical protein
MTRILRGVAAAMLMAFVAACDGDSPTRPSSETARFTAQLSPTNEVPPVTGPESTATGTVTIEFAIGRDAGGAITSAVASFQMQAANFPLTSTITMAHIHRGAVGVNGLVVVDTGVSTGLFPLAAGAGSLSRSGISVTPAIAQEILSNPAAFYFNIHSSLNTNGVLRGQLVRD